MRHKKRSTTAKPLRASGIRPAGSATNWEKARRPWTSLAAQEAAAQPQEGAEDPRGATQKRPPA